MKFDILVTLHIYTVYYLCRPCSKLNMYACDVRNMQLLGLLKRIMLTFCWCFCVFDKHVITLFWSSVLIYVHCGNLQLRQQRSFLMMSKNIFWVAWKLLWQFVASAMYVLELFFSLIQIHVYFRCNIIYLIVSIKKHIYVDDMEFVFSFMLLLVCVTLVAYTTFLCIFLIFLDCLCFLSLDLYI